MRNQWTSTCNAVASALLLTLGTGDMALAQASKVEGPGGSPANKSTPGYRHPAPLVALQNEPPARLIVDPPIPSELAQGRVVIQYWTENLRIRPVYGAAALDVSPRLGHIHVTVDGGWRWADASDEPLIINKLPPGPHTVLIELVLPTHHTIDSQLVSVVVPKLPATP
jgi:hypothetical protein